MTMTADSYDYSDLKDEVQDHIRPLFSEIPDYSSLNKDLGHHINRGYFDFVKRIGGIEDRIDITTVANQEAYTYADTGATNLKYGLKIIQVRWDEDSSDYDASDWEGQILVPFPGGYANLPKTRVYGRPYYYWYRHVGKKGGMTIGTWNIIDTADQRIRVWFTRMPSSLLSSDTDEPEIPVGWQEALVDFAVWKMYRVYSHKNKEYKEKAITHRDLYFEAVHDYKSTFALDNYDQALIIRDAYTDNEL